MVTRDCFLGTIVISERQLGTTVMSDRSQGRTVIGLWEQQ